MRTIALVLLALTGCAPKSAVSRIETLEARVDLLQQEVARLSSTRAPARGERPASAEGRASAERPASAGLTEEIREMVKELDRIARSGPMHEARRLCERFEREHAEALASPEGQTQYRYAKRNCDEAKVVGERAPALDVETWYQGAAPSADAPQVLVFWEVWCPHCKRELPQVEAMKDRLDPRVQFVGLTKVNRSASEEKVRAFMSANGISFPIAKENNASMSRAYAVTGVPAAAFIKDGEIVWRGHPARLSDATIEALLAR